MNSQPNAVHELVCWGIFHPQLPSAVRLAIGEVQVEHFGDGVTEGFVNAAFRGFSSVDM